MATLTTNGVRISIDAYYQPQHSNPVQRRYFFGYRVTIQNHNPYTVQLLRRHWLIWDSDGQSHEVEGEGVVGLQPVLKPGESHKYVSWCPLNTPIGRMSGTYLMVNHSNEEEFEVQIPEFKMEVPFLSN